MNNEFNLELAKGAIFKAIFTEDNFLDEFCEHTHWCRYCNLSLAFSIEVVTKRFYQTRQMDKPKQIKHVNSDKYDIRQEFGELIDIRFAKLILPTREECEAQGYVYIEPPLCHDEMVVLREENSHL